MGDYLDRDEPPGRPALQRITGSSTCSSSRSPCWTPCSRPTSPSSATRSGRPAVPVRAVPQDRVPVRRQEPQDARPRREKLRGTGEIGLHHNAAFSGPPCQSRISPIAGRTGQKGCQVATQNHQYARRQCHCLRMRARLGNHRLIRASRRLRISRQQSAEIDTIKAGVLVQVHRPRSVASVLTASAKLISFCATQIMTPPIKLIEGPSAAAPQASPRTIAAHRPSTRLECYFRPIVPCVSLASSSFISPADK